MQAHPQPPSAAPLRGALYILPSMHMEGTTNPDPGAEGTASEQLNTMAYGELRRIAHSMRRRGRPSATLSTTALVHEAYLRLSDQKHFNNRGHFYAVASIAMRQLLVDEAKKHARQKRGGGIPPISLGDHEAPVIMQAELMLTLDAALGRLAESSQRCCRVFECRFFAGLTEPETAAALDLSTRTVRREWAKARLFLADVFESPETE